MRVGRSDVTIETIVSASPYYRNLTLREINTNLKIRVNFCELLVSATSIKWGLATSFPALSSFRPFSGLAAVFLCVNRVYYISFTLKFCLHFRVNFLSWKKFSPNSR